MDTYKPETTYYGQKPEIKLIHPTRFPNGISFGHQPMTVLQIHQTIQTQLDKAGGFPNEKPQLDITCENASNRYTDHQVRILEPYYLTHESFQLITDGAITQKDELWADNVEKDEQGRLILKEK